MNEAQPPVAADSVCPVSITSAELARLSDLGAKVAGPFCLSRGERREFLALAELAVASLLTNYALKRGLKSV